MKTVVFVILFICVSSFAFAQYDFSIKPLPKIDFNKWEANESTNISFNATPANPDLSIYFSQHIKAKADHGTYKYSSKMPIANPQANYWDMPVFVPDSLVNYAIREKRFEMLKLKK